jgi:peptidoglycan/LPS O-acetylase OafA/YrhL
VAWFVTVQDKMGSSAGQTTGFDYLRIVLSVSVLIWHSIWYSGSFELDKALSVSPFRFVGPMILPLFFALSGFLVSGSLQRTRLYQFITLRVIRLVPALAVEVILSAILIGLIFTNLPISKYLANREFHIYFLNIIGIIHFTLPGVFENNPGGPYINAQLWTIPFELECYLALIVLAILTLVKRRFLFLLIVVALCGGLTILNEQGSTLAANFPGRTLVLCFLAASVLFFYRDILPYSHILGVLSAAGTIFLIENSNTYYLIAFPAAYTVVWLGLMRPPAIPFGDLSYGVFLFHLPIEQTVIRVFPGVRSWWLLTLVSLPLVFLFAWLSWNLIEKPTLTRKKQILAVVDRFWLAITAKLKFPRPLWSREKASSSAATLTSERQS